MARFSRLEQAREDLAQLVLRSFGNESLEAVADERLGAALQCHRHEAVDVEDSPLGAQRHGKEPSVVEDGLTEAIDGLGGQFEEVV